MSTDALSIIQTTFGEVLSGALSFLPQLLLAILVLIVGGVLAWALRMVVEKVIVAARVDELMKTLQITAFFERMNISFRLSAVLGWLVKWFVVVGFLIAAADILQWTQITVFLNSVVAYIPNAIIGIVILFVGLVLGSFVQRAVSTAVSAAQLGGEALLAGVAKWAIVLFSFVAALQQLGIATSLLDTITTGLMGMIAIGGGLAFGLGGQEHAKRFLDTLRKDISKS